MLAGYKISHIKEMFIHLFLDSNKMFPLPGLLLNMSTQERKKKFLNLLSIFLFLISLDTILSVFCNGFV